MQSEGSLKKKRKRNLAKVQGLCQLGYQEDKDNFRLNDFYDFSSERNLPRSLTKSGAGDPSKRFSIASPTFDVERGLISPYRIQTTGGDGIIHPSIERRPCLLSKNSVQRLRQIHILGVASLAFPWKWNSETYQLELFSPRIWKFWAVAWGLLTFQTSCLTLYQYYTFFANLEVDPEEGYRPVFMNSFSVLWYTYGTLHNILMYNSREAIRNYINCLFRSNRELVDRYVTTLEGYKEGGQALLNLSIPTNMIQVFVSTSLFLTFPALPWFLYKFIYTKDFPWYGLIPGAIHEFCFVGNHMAVYLLVAWVIVVHANSVAFWLTEAHNHNTFTGFTRNELRQPAKSLELYRALQILTTEFNNAMAPFALPVNKFVNWSATVPCMYVLIRSMDKFVDEFPGIMTYPFGVIDCVACAYGLLGMSAEMYDLAAGFLTSWSQTRQKELRKYLVSCPVLKVKVGSFYYITVTTTITYFNSLLNYTIDALVTFK